MRYRARAPLRIDFAGGWTDVPFYARNEGGAVLSAAITQYAHGHIAQPQLGGPLQVLRGDRSYVSYSLDVPAGAGLGGSAAQTVLWVTLVKTAIANVSDRREIAEIACQIGGLLGIVGGKQDEYASALGGLNYFTFGDTVEVERLHLGSDLISQLRSRLVLAYSGRGRISGVIHEHVWQRYRERDKGTVAALSTIKRVAREMKGALLAGDLDSFADLMSENWRSQKALHPSVSNQELDALFEFASCHGARGGKACGAGGGGCLVFLAAAGESDRLRLDLKRKGIRTITFDFDTYGVHLSKG